MRAAIGLRRHARVVARRLALALLSLGLLAPAGHAQAPQPGDGEAAGVETASPAAEDAVDAAEALAAVAPSLFVGDAADAGRSPGTRAGAATTARWAARR